MPVIIDRALPAFNELEEEGVFVMDEERAKTQDIRPLEIGFLNLMPNKEVTEKQFLRAIAGGTLQVRPTFIKPVTHVAKDEYERDSAQGVYPSVPKNYFPNNDPSQTPKMNWQANGHTLLRKWGPAFTGGAGI